MVRTYTALFRHEGDWWAAYVPDLPGAHAQGHTLDEARDNLKEAIGLILEVNRELAEQDAAGHEVIREELDIAVAA